MCAVVVVDALGSRAADVSSPVGRQFSGSELSGNLSVMGLLCRLAQQLAAPPDLSDHIAMTPKQENFCQLYIELGNASEAYRRSYDARQMSAATVNRKAKELLDNGKIAARLEQLRATHAERHAVTVDDIARMLHEDRQFAREQGKPSACVAATMGLAKLYGHLREKAEITGKGGAPLIPETMTTDEKRNMLADRIAEALARAPKQGPEPPTIQ